MARLVKIHSRESDNNNKLARISRGPPARSSKSLLGSSTKCELDPADEVFSFQLSAFTLPRWRGLGACNALIAFTQALMAQNDIRRLSNGGALIQWRPIFRGSAQFRPSGSSMAKRSIAYQDGGQSENSWQANGQTVAATLRNTN